MYERTKRVGIALEVDEVIPLFDGEFILELQALTLAEIGTDGLLARMAERRVAQVVSQTRSSDDFADVTQLVGPRLASIARHQSLDHLTGHRLAHARHFQAVCQPVVHKDAVGQRKHLRLVLQPAKRRGEYQAVIVALEVAAHSPTLLVVVMFQSQSLVGYQAVPIHALL